MRKFSLILIAGLLVYIFLGESEPSNQSNTTVNTQAASSQPAAQREASAALAIPAEFTRADVGRQVRGSGSVARVLSDDNAGSRHQRFILRLPSGQTLLIAHNIDLAPRVAGIAVNDSVEFYGEYEWNSQGGVVHWTHKDPNGRHTAGWLRSKGRTYQ